MTEENTELSQADIFNQAMSDAPSPEQTENVPETPAEAPVEAKETRARDDKGRFVPKAPEATPQEVQAQEPKPQVEETKEKPDHIPSWRLKEEADARREALARAEQAERAMQAYQQQLLQLQQQLHPQQQEPIDIFANPEAYVATVKQQMESMKREMAGEMSLRLASVRHGEETIKNAFATLSQQVQMGDRAAHTAIVNSPDPGEALVQWYKREETMKTIGDGGLESFAEKILAEALNNPEFLAQAMEKAKGVASTQPTQQVKIPPSLNKATAANVAATSDGMDYSQSSIFKYAMQR